MAHNNGTTNQVLSNHINTYRMVPVYHGRVQACIFDWAGNILLMDFSIFEQTNSRIICVSLFTTIVLS